MNKTIFFLLFIFNVHALFSQVSFEKWYGTSDWEYGFSAKECKEGGYIVCTSNDGIIFDGMNHSIMIVKTTIDGNILWSKIFSGNYGKYAGSIIQSNDGGFLFTGKSFYSFDTTNMFLIKIDNTGNLLWEKIFTFDFGGSPNQKAMSLLQTNDGGFIIGGGKAGSSIPPGIFLIKTDSLGNELWRKTYGQYTSTYNGIEQTPDSGYIIVGRTLSDKDIRVIKTDYMGNIIWDKYYDGPLGVDDGGYDIERTSDGGYIVAGYVTVFYGDTQGYLLKIDSIGNKQWERSYGDACNDFITSVHQLPDGGFICAGASARCFAYNCCAYDMWLMKTNQNGDSLWSRFFGGMDHDIARSMHITDDNGYILCGYTMSFGSGFADVYLVKTDSMGYVYFPQPAANFTIDSIIFSKAYFTNTSDSAMSYKWYFGDGDSSFLENPSHTYLDTGIYNVTLIAYAGNNSDIITKQLQISEVVGIQNLLNENSFDVQIYPNPFTYETKIKYNLPDNTANAALTIYNIIGEKIKEYKLNKKNGELIIDASDLPQGLYMLYIKNGQGLISNKRMLIVR